MADLVFLALTVGFFALMVLLVRACDHIIGPDPAPVAESAADVDGIAAGVGGATAVRP
jgi:hypothetical protein